MKTVPLKVCLFVSCFHYEKTIIRHVRSSDIAFNLLFTKAISLNISRDDQ